MNILELSMIGIGLGMDAFAVSICKGLSIKKMNWKKAIIIALYFGFFQGFMPLIGFFLGTGFKEQIKNIDHWIAFGLLLIIGAQMIINSFKDESENNNNKVDFKTMIVLAIATSIDALAIGVTFAFLQVNILLGIIIIGVITFLLSMIGVKLGNIFGDKYEKKSQIVGGAILILMGLKILLEHLEIIKI